MASGSAGALSKSESSLDEDVHTHTAVTSARQGSSTPQTSRQGVFVSSGGSSAISWLLPHTHSYSPGLVPIFAHSSSVSHPVGIQRHRHFSFMKNSPLSLPPSWVDKGRDAQPGLESAKEIRCSSVTAVMMSLGSALSGLLPIRRGDRRTSLSL